MSIEVGQSLPEATFQSLTADGVERLSCEDVFRDKKVVLVGVPGAFTPVCDQLHLPGLLEHANALKATGVDHIALTSTNDAFVLDAWSKAAGAAGVIQFLADVDGRFAKSVGLAFDASDRGMGIRSHRYSMVVENGVVTRLAVEDAPTKVNASSAATLLDDLRLREPEYA